MPRTIKRLHLPTEAKPAFAEVDQAWVGVGSEAPEPKSSSFRKALSKKVDTAEQSKLSQHGFLKKENVRKCPPVNFDRAFNDEDDLMTDEDDPEHGFHRESSSPTPRKAPASRTLGSVPAPPFDPRLRPAGVREVQRRQRLRETERTYSGHSKSDDDDLKDDRDLVNKDQPAGRSEDDDVPSSQAFENQEAIFRSDSTNEMELQVSTERIEEVRQLLLKKSRV